MANEDGRCAQTNPLTGTRCQLLSGHELGVNKTGHVFPPDDAFLEAFADGDIVIGRPPSMRGVR
jgi:hypothetical protein